VILYSKKMFSRSSTLLLPVSPAKIIIVIRTGDKLIRSDAMAIIRMSEPNVICEVLVSLEEFSAMAVTGWNRAA